MTSTLGSADVTCSLPAQNKLRHHLIVGINVFPRKLMKFPRMEKVNSVPAPLLICDVFWSREDKGDREGIPHTHPIPKVIRLELFLESG